MQKVQVINPHAAAQHLEPMGVSNSNAQISLCARIHIHKDSPKGGLPSDRHLERAIALGLRISRLGEVSFNYGSAFITSMQKVQVINPHAAAQHLNQWGRSIFGI